MNFNKLSLILPLSLLICLALSATAAAKKLTFPVEQLASEDMAPYQIQVTAPRGWKVAMWDRANTGVTLSRKLSKKCLAVMAIDANEEHDYDSTEPNPAGAIESLPQNFTIEGLTLTGQGPLTNQDPAPGGFNLSPSGQWGLYSFREDSKPAFLGAAVYYQSQREEDSIYFKVPFLQAVVTQNQGFGGTKCKAKELRPMSKVISKLVQSTQLVSP